MQNDFDHEAALQELSEWVNENIQDDFTCEASLQKLSEWMESIESPPPPSPSYPVIHDAGECIVPEHQETPAERFARDFDMIDRNWDSIGGGWYRLYGYDDRW